ncbi:hypothetical protein B0T24DRAFT_666870 [Lasiosphaeria ovina]|uniref:Uncharacterized protein n=1 Tax=Lasiosphaeria ovina TaxID=92902 RepID=A0AAE0KCW6_9PEZI|nr:hypothetical protein B0T24DRAFT_666870 [Lasiosphaeria ovina]
MAPEAQSPERRERERLVHREYPHGDDAYNYRGRAQQRSNAALQYGNEAHKRYHSAPARHVRFADDQQFERGRPHVPDHGDDHANHHHHQSHRQPRDHLYYYPYKRAERWVYDLPQVRSQSERRHYHFHEGRWEPLRARHHGAGSHYDTWNEPVQFEPDEAGIHPRQWFEKLEKLEAQVIAFSGLPNENLAKPLRPLGYRNRGAACTLVNHK